MQTFKLLPHDSVMLIQPELIEHFGRAGAQFLNQLHYWLEQQKCGKQHQGKNWIYNTEESWAQQLRLSVRQFRRHVSTLKKMGVIFVKKLSSHKSNRTNYFSINYAGLEGLTTENKPECIASLSAETRSFVHEDIMASSSGQNGLLYIDTKITNKDLNKSEDLLPQKNPEELYPEKQVEQVENKISKNKEKNSTVQEMLEIWNENFQDKANSKLNKAIAPLLVAAFKTKFESKLENWKAYCTKIKSSSYLMSDAFKLTIAWALKFLTIDRIGAGELGVRKNKPVALDDIQINQMIDDLDESADTKAVRHTIAKAIGYAAYYSWFHQAKFVEKNGEVRLVAPNAFVEQYWQTHFDWVMKNDGYGC